MSAAPMRKKDDMELIKEKYADDVEEIQRLELLKTLCFLLLMVCIGYAIHLVMT